MYVDTGGLSDVDDDEGWEIEDFLLY